MPDFRALSLAPALLLASALPAQAPGQRLYAPRSGSDTYLLDNAGNRLHVWPGVEQTATAVYPTADGHVLRMIRAETMQQGGGNGIQEMTFDGTVVWDFRYETHGLLLIHDIAPMPNGDVVCIGWEEKTRAEAIAAGRDPAITASMVLPAYLVELKPTGPTSAQVVWEWHVWDHLVQDFAPAMANYGNVAGSPQLIDLNFPQQSAGELNHITAVDYDPVRDLVLVSSAFQGELWIIDHATTTAEAAGHTGGGHGKGGDLLYRWGNSAAYRHGTAANQRLFTAHGCRFVPAGYPGAGHVLVFNNQAQPRSEVDELALPRDGAGRFVLAAGGTYGPAEAAWTYSAPGFDSDLMSSAERLPNGNTLICSALQSWIFEVTASGQRVWEVKDPTAGSIYNACYVDRSAWADRGTLSVSAGGSTSLTLLGGSRLAGSPYLMLGSLSGTSPGVVLGGQTVPLVPDSYFDLTVSAAGSALLPGSFGTTDGLGRATASLVLPPAVATALAGSTLHHAFVVADPQTLAILQATNAVPLALVP